MKTIIFLIFLSFSQVFIAQTVPVLINICATGNGGPNRMFADGDEIYFSKVPEENKVVKFDASQGFPIPSDIVSEPNNEDISDVLVIGTDLYFVSFGSGIIYKQDLTNTSLPPVPVITGLVYPKGISLKNNEMYVANTNAGMIVKFDVTVANPVLDTVVTGLSSPNGLAFDGNDLYISLTNPGKILKIDILVGTPTPIEIVTGLGRPIGLQVKNNFLVIATFDDNKIVTLDLNNPSAGVSDLVPAFQPVDIVFIGDEMFISEYAGNKISKLQNAGLSVEKAGLGSTSIFPNPTADFVSISNVSKDIGYAVVSFDGRVLKKGDFLESNRIDMRNLNSGMYVLNLTDGSSTKIVKK